jgi:hypothetical protein
MSLSTKVLIGLAAGITTGLFLGELAAPLSFVGHAFILLLQMTVLPFMIVALVSALGRLDGKTALALARSGGLVLVVLWAIVRHGRGRGLSRRLSQLGIGVVLLAIARGNAAAGGLPGPVHPLQPVLVHGPVRRARRRGLQHCRRSGAHRDPAQGAAPRGPGGGPRRARPHHRLRRRARAVWGVRPDGQRRGHPRSGRSRADPGLRRRLHGRGSGSRVLGTSPA